VASKRENKLAETNRKLVQENTLLRQKIDVLLRRMHGTSSEKISPDQLEALEQQELLEDDQPDGPGKPKGDDLNGKEAIAKGEERKPRSKPRIPDHLPVESRDVIQPQEVIDDPEGWRQIGEEISQYLDFEPGHFFKHEIVRPKYVRIDDPEQPPLIASLPSRWTDRCIASPGLLAHIAVSKFVDHLPLFRQEGIFKKRHGIAVPRNTMSRWMEMVSENLRLIYNHMVGELISGDYLQVDETPIKYLEPGRGKAPQGYFWAYSNPKGDVVFDWQTGRNHECLLEMLRDPDRRSGERGFQGTLQCDGYAAYKTVARKISGIHLMGCWAHVRRKFRDALEHSPVEAGKVLREIQHLYRIEKVLREDGAEPSSRKKVRNEQSRPILRELKKALIELRARPSVLPKSSIGKAIDYALGEWEWLETYLEDGRVEIDNNLIENAIRPTALGKKNWMFIGRAETGERSAIIYSVIESCRRRGIDPYAYLKDVLSRMPSATTGEIKHLTPGAWVAAQPLANAA